MVTPSFAPPELEVSEIFSSIQGEGVSCGRRATFLRTRRCNLACEWCDTRYTWDAKDPGYAEYDMYTPDTLVERLRAAHTPLLVITGGEPMIWTRFFTPNVMARIAELYERVEIETNGTVMLRAHEFLTEPKVHFNVSPKLGSSHQPDRITQRRDPLMQFAALASYRQRATFKFVVSGAYDQMIADTREIEDILNTFNIARESVYLMLEGTTEESQVGTPLQWLCEQAARLRVNVTPRLHILAFGDTRGT